MREQIRRRLEDSAPPVEPLASALGRLPDKLADRLTGKPFIPAAVLLPLVDAPGGLELVLTRRTDHLRDHAGQISFPGGRVETTDTGPLATALREAGEETGLDAATVEVAGYLPPHAVVTGFVVTPVVGLVAGQPVWQPDDFEVAEIFQVPPGLLSGSGQSTDRHPALGRGGLRRQRVSLWIPSHLGRHGPDHFQFRRYYR